MLAMLVVHQPPKVQPRPREAPLLEHDDGPLNSTSCNHYEMGKHHIWGLWRRVVQQMFKKFSGMSSSGLMASANELSFRVVHTSKQSKSLSHSQATGWNSDWLATPNNSSCWQAKSWCMRGVWSSTNSTIVGLFICRQLSHYCLQTWKLGVNCTIFKLRSMCEALIVKWPIWSPNNFGVTWLTWPIATLQQQLCSSPFDVLLVARSQVHCAPFQLELERHLDTYCGGMAAAEGCIGRP